MPLFCGLLWPSFATFVFGLILWPLSPASFGAFVFDFLAVFTPLCFVFSALFRPLFLFFRPLFVASFGAFVLDFLAAFYAFCVLCFFGLFFQLFLAICLWHHFPAFVCGFFWGLCLRFFVGFLHRLFFTFFQSFSAFS